MSYVLLVMMESPAHPYFTHFCRSDVGDIDEADKFHKEAADIREICKQLLAAIVEKTLGDDNSMSDEVLDNLLQRSDIRKKLLAMDISMENNDEATQMSAYCTILTYLGNVRSMLYFS